MKIKTTARGFAFMEFEDQHGERCIIQKSSLATEDAIWLGINEPKLTVFAEDMGKYVTLPMPSSFDVSSRMHLTIQQVRDILPILAHFAETGEIHNYTPNDQSTDNENN